MARAMDPVVFEVLFDRLAAELVRQVGIEAGRDPKNPDIGVEERQGQRRRFAPDRAGASLEPGEEGLLDPFEVLDPGAREPKRFDR